MVTGLDEAGKPSITHSYPGVWIQYKGDRARVLQMAEESARQSLVATIIDEFRADLEALSLAIPGDSMQIRIIWGTGQVRATCSLRTPAFCKILKDNVGRALRSKKMLSDRSIAHILYAEGNGVINLRESTSGQAKPKAANKSSILQGREGSSPSNLTPSTELQPQNVSSGTGSRPIYYAPDSSVEHSNDSEKSYLSGELLFRRTAGTPSSSISGIPQVPHPPRTNFSKELRAPQILPPIYIGRVNGRSALDYGEKSPPTGNALTLPQPSSSARPSMSTGKAALPLQSALAPKPLLPFPVTAGPRPLTIPAPPALTPGTCVRLADPSNESIVSTSHVVRFLVIRDAVTFREGERTKAYEAYITDGDGYSWIALASALSGRICKEDDRRSLQVGSTARISGITRLHAPDTCIALVCKFDLLDVLTISSPANDHWHTDIGCSDENGFPVKSGVDDNTSSHSDMQQERAARLLAEMRYREERRRRVVLERALADVCRDLHRKNAQDTLVPAALEALMAIDELADAAMVVADRTQVGGE